LVSYYPVVPKINHSDIYINDTTITFFRFNAGDINADWGLFPCSSCIHG